MKRLNLIGKIFGKLLVVGYSGKNKYSQSIWLCKCECGNSKMILGNNLMKGDTKSCGCLHKESITTHGFYGTRTYNIWKNMLARCFYEKNIGYKNYGGRGIKVCNRWLKFENFLEDMGKCPGNKTLDRINNNLGYFKKNCRWISHEENNRNKNNNRNYTLNNKTQCLIAWAEEYRMNRKTLEHRLNRGLCIKDALTIPIRKRIK